MQKAKWLREISPRLGQIDFLFVNLSPSSVTIKIISQILDVNTFNLCSPCVCLWFEKIQQISPVLWNIRNIDFFTVDILCFLLHISLQFYLTRRKLSLSVNTFHQVREIHFGRGTFLFRLQNSFYIHLFMGVLYDTEGFANSWQMLSQRRKCLIYAVEPH